MEQDFLLQEGVDQGEIEKENDRNRRRKEIEKET